MFINAACLGLLSSFPRENCAWILLSAGTGDGACLAGRLGPCSRGAGAQCWRPEPGWSCPPPRPPRTSPPRGCSSHTPAGSG